MLSEKQLLIKEYAEQLLEEHGLAEKGWVFIFDRAPKRYGQCVYTKKHISVSRQLTELNTVERTKETVVHELAHALTPGAHHGPAWQEKCRELGIEPERCYGDEVIQPDPKWVVTAGGEEIFIKYVRKPRIKNWGDRWIQGRKADTEGKLQVMSYDDYVAQYGEI